jgi:dihydroneopterin aldolase
MISDRERAAFEAGIKLGALYHQWVGTPVSRESAHSLERAMENAHIQQPYVTEISVGLDQELMIPNSFGYSELGGLMLDVELTIRVNQASCHASLSREGEYPMMRIEWIDEESELSDH